MMKITIDTQTDTHEDIKKVLDILTNIIEKSSHAISDISSGMKEETVDATPMEMFNGGPPEPDPEPTPKPEPHPEPEPEPEPSPPPEPEPESSPEPADTPPDFNALLSLTRKKEEEKKEPKIEFF